MKKIGGKNDIAFVGPQVGDVAHMRVDSENLLQQHDARPRSGSGSREVAAHAAADVDPSVGHVQTPFRFSGVPSKLRLKEPKSTEPPIAFSNQVNIANKWHQWAGQVPEF